MGLKEKLNFKLITSAGDLRSTRIIISNVFSLLFVQNYSLGWLFFINLFKCVKSILKGGGVVYFVKGFYGFCFRKTWKLFK